MEIQEIEVTIDKNGQVIIQVRGVKGTICLDLTKDLETSLGNLVEERILQTEFLEPPETPINLNMHIKTGK